MSVDPKSELVFEEAARSLRKRFGGILFALWLVRSHLWIGIAGLLLVLGLRQFWEWRSGESWAVLGLMAAWLMAGIVIAWIRRPDSFTALSRFDRAGQWRDQFSSAYFFVSDRHSQGENLSVGEKLHVSRARKELGEKLPDAGKILPLPDLKKVWILPVVAIAFSLTPWLRKELSPSEMTLTEEMVKSAAGEADRIRMAAKGLSELQSLSEEEKEALEKLESDVELAADDIGNSVGQTAGEVLSSLETRARAAERLAEKLGLSNADEWASEEFVRELGQHADTADLAIGIKDRNPELVADQADAIAGVLKREDLKRETADRFAIALERSLSRATDEDRKKVVGERIGNASGNLTARQPVGAGEEFEALAGHFRRVRQREDAREKLEELAEQLRSSGSQISGSKLENLKKIADSAGAGNLPEGLQPIESTPMATQLQNLMAPQVPQPNQPGDSSGTPMPIPGSLGQNSNAPGQGQGGKGKGQKGEGGEGVMAPIPGQPGNNPAGEGQGIASGPGGNKGDGMGGGMLMAPVPGSSPGQNVPGSGLGGASGGQGQGQGGGDKAGSGTMAMFEQEGNITEADQEARIEATLNEDGESEFRAVEGQSGRTEAATRSRRDIASSFIDVEESALDEKSLPITRRNQVMRYFSEIRRQLEEE